MNSSIRQFYQTHGVDAYYKNYAESYHNPHSQIITRILDSLKPNLPTESTYLDLCCGDGIITSWLQDNNVKNITGVDPYTHSQYTAMTGINCESLSFKDIVINGLDRKFDIAVCSFAIHLCPKSLLPQLLYRLSQSCKQLIIISPHKIHMEQFFTEQLEMKLNRVYCKVYDSKHYEGTNESSRIDTRKYRRNYKKI